jgi:CRP/FNR family transcriptional regulator, cyclic AMP receptor protein
MRAGEIAISADGRRSFLAALDSSEAADLHVRGIVRKFPRASAMFHRDQVSDRALVLLSGYVKLCSISDDGREVVLAIRGPGDLIGELGVLDGRPRSATAITLQPVEALVLAGSAFRSFLANHPRVAIEIISMLSSRLRDADLKRVEFAARDSLSRVAARLLELSDRFGDPLTGGMRIDLPISQEELAGWTGCSRDSVVKALQAMRALGWIETQRMQITVRDLEALRRQAGEVGVPAESRKTGISSDDNSVEGDPHRA